MKHVKEILIRVTLADGRVAEAYFVRAEKVTDLMTDDGSLGGTLRDLVESIPSKKKLS